MSNLISDLLNGKSESRNTDRRKGGITGMTGHVVNSQENPYVSARREWNERYGSYIARARTWQFIALGSMALSAVLGISLVSISSQSRVQPFVVQVDKLGEAVAVRPADVAAMPDERIIRFQLANYITSARSITPDPVVQKRWLNSIYAVSTTSAAQFLNDHYKKDDPFNTGRTSLVAVDIQTALPLSKNSWQINWTETRRSLSGQTEGITRWQAILNLSVFTPTTQQQIIANPTGILIDQITWTQQL